MPTKAGLPGWFPEDFKTDPDLHAAFEDDADWHAAGQKPGKAAVKAKLRARLKDHAAGRGSEHAVTWADHLLVIEMAAAAVPGQTATPAGTAASLPPRVPSGVPAGGQFTAPGGTGASKPAAKPMDAHQKHVAHLQHLATHGTPAQQKAAAGVLARMGVKP